MKIMVVIQEWIHFVGFAAVVLMMASILTGWGFGLIVGAFWLANVVVVRQIVLRYFGNSLG